jgi:hypothetical protein
VSKEFFIVVGKYNLNLRIGQLQAPGPSRRFDPPNEVKQRLHRSAQERLSGLNKALALFLLDGGYR